MIDKGLFTKNSYIGLLVIFIAMICSSVAEASSNQYKEEVRGKVSIFGTVTEGACRLSMDSANQSINMGNIESSELNKAGKRARSVPFNIELYDCGGSSRNLIFNPKTGTQVWSTAQPAVSIRFIAPTIENDSTLAKVNGVKGLGLELTNSYGSVIKFGELSRPIILNTQGNTITYNITPIRTPSPLQAGAYSAVFIFELSYD